MASKEQLKILKQGVAVWNLWRRKNKLSYPDISNADLQGYFLDEVNLDGANIQGAILRYASLKGASFRRAVLRLSSLKSENLARAVLDKADLQKANLEDAVLEAAELEGADLQTANLKNANLQGANLKGVDLRESILKVAQMQGSNLEFANLVDADLQNANLEGAILTRANLQGANLKGANMKSATLSEAIFVNAFLEGAILEGAVFSPETFTNDQLKSACFEDSRMESSEYKSEEKNRSDPTFRFEYPDGMQPWEWPLVPAMLAALEADHRGLKLKLKSINNQDDGRTVVTVALLERPPARAGQTQRQADDDLVKRLQSKNESLMKRVRENEKLIDKLQNNLKETTNQLNAFKAKEYDRTQGNKIDISGNFALMFFDLVGFSKMEPEERNDKLTALHPIAHATLRDWAQARYHNTWGDGITAIFEDPARAVEAACVLRDTLCAMQIRHRIGMHYGSVEPFYNSLMEQTDILGQSVVEAARLEPLGEDNQVLISAELHFKLDTRDKLYKFKVKEQEKKLKKSTGAQQAGEDVICYSVSLNHNVRPAD